MGQLQLMGETRRAVLGHLLHGDRTAAELARLSGVNIAAMRRHLEGMEAMTFVRSYFVRRGLGRPKKYFAIAVEGREVLGKKYDVVLSLLISRILDREGEAKARALLRSLASDFADQAKDQMAGKRGEERMQTLVAFFNEMGFPTSLERQGRHWVIVKRDCILFKVAQAHERLICEEFDNEIIRAALGGGVKVDHGMCLARGDDRCHQMLVTLRSK